MAGLLGDSSTAKQLGLSLAPYLSLEGENGAIKPLEGSSDTRPECWLGKNFIAVQSRPVTESVEIPMPDGVWINYWTGAQVSGGRTLQVEIPGGSLPLWTRAGAVVQRRSGGYGNGSLLERKSETEGSSGCGAVCIFELFPGFDETAPTTEKGVDGRTLSRSANSLRVAGAATHALVRWRFTQVDDVRINGRKVAVQSSPEGFYASFDHTGESLVEWNVKPLPRSW